MANSYLFYDLETSGLNKCFDQILQFAAIRTDHEFNTFERYNIFVKLNPDCIPSPEAFITHRISLDKLKNLGIFEIDAVEKIHALFNTPNTISVGYNSFGFDDEFLRFSFYRNLLPPYTHQYANNCNRIDLYPLTVLYYLFKNAILQWPVIEKVPSLKLEHLNAVNDLHTGIAHDAMSDTEAILKLAQIFYQDRKMWEYASGYFDKNIDLARIEQLPQAFSIGGQSYKEGIMLDGAFGAEQYYQCPMLYLGWHKHYKNQMIWLKLDQEALASTVIDSIPQTTYIYRKKAGENGLLLPPISRFMRYLCSERITLIAQNKHWIEKNPHLLAAIRDYHLDYKYPFVPNVDVDAELYQIEFLKPYEEDLCRKFHAGDIKSKLFLQREFPNANLRARALRILGRNYREFLPEAVATEYTSYLEKVKTEDDISAIIDYRGDRRLTPKVALHKIDELREKRDLRSEQIKILEDLKQYLKNLA